MRRRSAHPAILLNAKPQPWGPLGPGISGRSMPNHPLLQTTVFSCRCKKVMHVWAHKPTANRFLCKNMELLIQIKKKKKINFMWWPDSYFNPALGSAGLFQGLQRDGWCFSAWCSEWFIAMYFEVSSCLEILWLFGMETWPRPVLTASSTRSIFTAISSTKLARAKFERFTVERHRRTALSANHSSFS